MIFHKSRWHKTHKKFENSLELAKEFHLSEKIINILQQRGHNSKEALNTYLYPKINHLHDPFLLKDMKTLVEALKSIKGNHKKIVIYGDYDVDGITSIAILFNYMKGEGYEVDYYIPNRFEEGYGLNNDALDKIKAAGGDFVLTVDCGITSVAEAEHARAIDLPLFITDHHQCQEALPECLGIINPKQADCHYPFDMLAGAGIALKIVQALSGDDFSRIYPQYVDIAAIGTIADIAPLVDENRIIAKYGLKALEITKNIGLKSMLQEVDLVGKELNSGHIGFGIGPRLNAAGRVDSAALGVQLLTASNLHEAQAIAEELNSLNHQRQEMEQSIIAACIEQVESRNMLTDKILVLSGQGWHTGVIGIVASRISERYYKPTVILNVEANIAKGSARSVGDFSIFDAMHASKELFLKFGGHKAAAGVSMLADNVDTFRKEINAYGDQHMTIKDFYPRIHIDAILSSEDIAHDFAEALDGLKPFGVGNPKPCFIYEDLIVDTVRWLGKDQQHLKLSVHDGVRVYDCIKFNGSEEERKIRTGDHLDAVFTLDINKFRGVETLQFALKDLFVKNRISQAFEVSFFISFIDSLSIAHEKTLLADGQGRPLETMFTVLDDLIDHNKRFVLTVGSITGLRAIEGYFINRNFEDYSWSFGQFEANQNAVVVNPLAQQTDRDHVLALDILWSVGDQEIYSTNEKRKEFKVYKEKLTVQISIFKYLYKELAGLKEKRTLKVLGDDMKLAPYIVYLGAKIFEERGLMDIHYKDGWLHVVKVHKPSQKVDLMDSIILKRIDRL